MQTTSMHDTCHPTENDYLKYRFHPGPGDGDGTKATAAVLDGVTIMSLGDARRTRNAHRLRVENRLRRF